MTKKDNYRRFETHSSANHLSHTLLAWRRVSRGRQDGIGPWAGRTLALHRRRGRSQLMCWLHQFHPIRMNIADDIRLRLLRVVGCALSVADVESRIRLVPCLEVHNTYVWRCGQLKTPGLGPCPFIAAGRGLMDLNSWTVSLQQPVSTGNGGDFR